MPLKTGRDLATHLDGIILEKFQVHRYCVDLTVRNIFEVDPIGRVDFGGGEYTPAGRIEITPRPERTEDAYLWWTLARGCYFVEFNETLKLNESEIAILEPDERLMRAGGTHSPAFFRGNASPIETLLVVDVLRLQIKKNARIARLRLFSLE
jgi:deoxycytidine triphosphate deaminase